MHRVARIFVLILFLSSFSLWGCMPKAEPKPATQSRSIDALREQQRTQRATIGVRDALKQIRSGDLLVRRGNDFTSEALRQINLRNKSYSHCGIVHIERDTAWVYHALGGEFNPDQRILRETIWQFCHPNGNKGFGLFRFEVDEQRLAPAIRRAQEAYQAGITFDMDFDLETDQQQYCAEFVWKCFREVDQLKHDFRISELGGKRFVGVDDLFLHPRCTSILAAAYP